MEREQTVTREKNIYHDIKGIVLVYGLQIINYRFVKFTPNAGIGKI